MNFLYTHDLKRMAKPAIKFQAFDLISVLLEIVIYLIILGWFDESLRIVHFFFFSIFRVVFLSYNDAKAQHSQ